MQTPMNAISQNSSANQVGVKPSVYVRLLSWGIALGGAVVITTGVAGLATGVGEENNATSIFVPFAFGLALVISGVAFGGRWQKAAFWFSMAMVGQTCGLLLINAGYQLRYQHYKPLGELLQYPNVLYLAPILVQLVLVIVAARDVVAPILRWMRANLRPWQVIILALCFFLPTTTVSPDVSVYLGELFLAGCLQLVTLATFVLFARAIPDDSIGKLRGIFNQVTQDTDDGSRLGLRFASIVALFVVVLAVILNVYSYQRHPHVPDEVAYLMQARFFASGVITTPAPPVPEAFEVFLMKVDGAHWYPVTPPGWAMILALGVLVGAPFVVNPILAGVNLLLVFWLIARLYSISAARLTALLLAASPWFIFLAMSFMTHMATLTCLLVAAIGVVKARERQSWSWGLVSGLGIGFLSLIRPLEAVAVAGLIGIWILGIGGKRLGFAPMGAVAIGTLLIGGLGLAYNSRLTGDPLQFPVNVYTDQVFGPNSNALGFGPDRGMGWQLDPYPGHSPLDALINTNLNVSALNTELLGWSIGSFLMIGFFLCFGKIRQSDYLMLALVAVIYTLHFFYYFSGGPDFGARYWFLMILPLLVLTVRGIESLASRLREYRYDLDIRLYTAAGALTILTLIVFIPWRAVDKYHNFRGMKPGVRELAEEFDFGRSLVLIRGTKHPDYDSAFIYNSIDLAGDGPVFAWDKDGVTREKLLSLFADRSVWVVNSPSLTGRNFEVAAGPLSTGSLLTQVGD